MFWLFRMALFLGVILALLPSGGSKQIAATPRAKDFAKKADRLISVGKLEDARVALVTALQDDYNNEELKERLDVLYEALALEPL